MRSLSLLLGAAALSLATDVQDCSCGFLDPKTGQLFTDATIVYFNETTDLPQDFYVQHYAHKKEYGWNTVYRSGVIASNVAVANTSTVNDPNYTPGSENWKSESLALFIDPSTNSHLINGASVESMRQDMLYGSFRAFMRGPEANSGGSAMSMIMEHNRSSGFEMDMLNGGDFLEARIAYLKDGEFPGTSVSTNYSMLAKGSNGTMGFDPWEFVELRMDWTKQNINYTIANNKTRVVKTKSSIPTEPLPLIFRHWSTGDANYMQGPPYYRSEANVAWIRAFFNSSLATKATDKAFDARCLAESKCNVDDAALRGSTSYSPKALIPFKQPSPNEKWRVPVAIACGSATALGVIFLINVFFKRKPWKTMFNGEKRYEPAVLDLGADLTSPYVNRDGPPSDNQSIVAGGEKGAAVSIASYRGGLDPKERSVVTSSVSPTNEDEDQLAELADTGVRRRSIFRGARYDSIPNTGSSKDRPLSAISKTSRGSVEFQGSPQPNPFGNFHNFTFGDSKVRAQSIPNVVSHDFASDLPQSGTPRQRQMSLFAQSRALSSVHDDLDREEDEEDDAGALPVRDVRERQGSVFQSVAMSVVRLGSIAPTITSIPEEPFTNERLGEEAQIDIKEWNTQARHEIPTIDPTYNALAEKRRPTIAEAVPIPSIDLPLPAAKAGEKRVNYLAGLVAFACVGVTGIHFCLTFIPYAGGLNEGQHYRSEYWARWTVTPFLLDPIWLGPLFVTSCRFLVAPFFKRGDLKDIATKVLLRAPRMLIPAIMVATLEYFFLEEGLLAWLEYLPSITWSSWPYIISYSNFAQFMNDILELAYLIPNAAPQIVEHYCVGVLWTVPVQLQFSYTALLVAVIVRDIKTPWKRFFVYFIGITTNWYALNWGSCFWAGVMLADLQITFEVSKKLQANLKVWIPLSIFLWCLAIACPVMSMLEDRLDYKTMTSEHNIHPDFTTGRPIGSTQNAGYPRYFEPRLNTLVFAVTIQFLLETSTIFQAVLSLRIWQPIFPHAYTIYLVHGFIWWTWGSFICVKLGTAGVPYWANMLLTALSSYTILTLTVIVVSPLTEMTNAAGTRNIGRWATQVPVPMRPTLSPFPHNLFLDRTSSDDDKKDDDEEAGAGIKGPDSKDDDAVTTATAAAIVEGSGKRKPTLLAIEEVESSATSTKSYGQGSASGSTTP